MIGDWSKWLITLEVGAVTAAGFILQGKGIPATAEDPIKIGILINFSATVLFFLISVGIAGAIQRALPNIVRQLELFDEPNIYAFRTGFRAKPGITQPAVVQDWEGIPLYRLVGWQNLTAFCGAVSLCILVTMLLSAYLHPEYNRVSTRPDHIPTLRQARQ